MEAIKISVAGADALVTHAPVIASGTVGLPVEFIFDEAWEGLTKTAVYKAGGTVRDQVDIQDRGTVPAQVLQTPYRMLRIGVYGASEDGTVVIPTVWAAVDEIRPGTEPSGDESTNPQLPVWQQMLHRVEALEENMSAELPCFDLTAMGLPVVPMDGTAVKAACDTTEIMAAARKGPVFITADTTHRSLRVLLNNVDDGDVVIMYGTVPFISSTVIPYAATVLLGDGYVRAFITELATAAALGDISTALNDLHAYAEDLKGGESA